MKMDLSFSSVSIAMGAERRDENCRPYRGLHDVLHVLTLMVLLMLVSCSDCGVKEYVGTCLEPTRRQIKKEITLTYSADDLNHRRREGTRFLGFGEPPAIIADTRIHNTSHKGGKFDVKVVFASTFGEDIELTGSRFIESGESASFNWEHILEGYEGVKFKSYKVQPPTVTEIEEVIEEVKVPCKKFCDTCDDPDCMRRDSN